MRSALALVTLSVLLLAGAALGTESRAHAQASQTPTATQGGPDLTLTGEMFCSETKLRTSNARLRWRMTRAALAAAGLPNLSGARQSLETTVYKNGFEKGLSIALQVGSATADRPVAPVLSQPRLAQIRAFQIRLIEVNQTRAIPPSEGDSEMSAVVEGLEPGVNYTWRVVIDTSAGRTVSGPVRYQAATCPADLIETPIIRRRQP